jgi:uroporphyrinogen decarboxylase
MLLLDALQLSPTKRRPLWIMRQAGRYLASFRKIREGRSFDDLALNPELALEVSLLPLKRYSLDAAIVFSDILYPLRALGAELSFTSEGPILKAPQSSKELDKLKKEFDPQESTPAILQTLRELRKTVSKEIAVIGFAGAPFTTLSYLLEGKLTRDLSTMKRWMAEEPATVHRWLAHLSKSLGKYLDAQAEAGADVVQLFDTWASVLSPKMYEEFALPYAREVLSQVTVPSIYYVNGVENLLEQVASVGAQAISVDWRISLSEARKRVSSVTALQGNLDPSDLKLPRQKLREKVFEMCSSYGTGPGHIVNLGHGITPDSPEEGVDVFIESVREWSLKTL